jgi:tetratricopeptide (TPR) repeat protein
LRAIPFRSPYRDLRLILKSLSLVGDDTAQAAELIARVGRDGPFERLAAVARAAVLTGSAWLVAMLGLDDDGRQMLLDLKGCPENRRSLLFEVAELARSAAPLLPATVVGLLLRRSRGLPASAAKLCRRLLPFAAKRLDDYRNAFGPLAEAERECILARGAENADDQPWIGRHWLRAAAIFAQREAAPLQAALILRHLFELVAGSGDLPDCTGESLDWLQRSLEFDPDDRGTHLKLISIYRQKQDLRAARASVDAALARFPNDPAVLLEAVETALAGNAFKKAVTLAKRLLELDPINSRVRALIGQAHLAHARKQIRSRRTEAAGKELALAEEWLAAAHERSIAKLLRGLSAATPEADALLRDAVSELGGNLLAAFHVLLESLRVGGAVSGVLRRAGITLSGTSTPREVVAVMHASNMLAAAERRGLQTVFETLRAQLLRSVHGAFSESERITVCEAALRWNESRLLRAYADAGLRAASARPIFVYFAIFGRYGEAACWQMSDEERLTVERARAKAEQDGDQRTVLRLGELSRWPRSSTEEESDDASALLDELPVSPRSILELLVAMGGHEEFIRMACERLPESVFRPLERAAGGDRKKLAELLVARLAELDPSFFNGAIADEVPVAKPRTPSPRREPPVVDDRQRSLFDD